MRTSFLINGLFALTFNKRNVVSWNVTYTTTDVFTTTDVNVQETIVVNVTTTDVNVQETIVTNATTTVDTTTTADVTTTVDAVTTDALFTVVAVETTTVVETVTTTQEAPVVTQEVVIINNEQNFCESVGLGDSIIRGQQSLNVSCSLTVLGVVPSFDNMVSTIILTPSNGEIISLGDNFTVTIFSVNIDFGFFDDPNSQYYLSPQTINSQGEIQGHSHVTIQKIEDPSLPPDARTPVFFIGLNEPSLDGTLSVFIDGNTFNVSGAGTYRICTITTSRSHTPVLLPVARRGTADDCIRVTVV